MPISLSLNEDEFDQIKNACLDYAFLGRRVEEADQTNEDENQLRESVLAKLGLTGNDGMYLSWHDNKCKCVGCTEIRKHGNQ